MQSDWSDNPYAPPRADLEDPLPAAQPVRIEKSFLVVPRKWISPPICLLTGETAGLSEVRHLRHRAVCPLMALHGIALFLAANGIYLLALLFFAAGVLMQRFFGIPGHWFLFPRTRISHRLSRRLLTRRKWLTAAAVLLGTALYLLGPDQVTGAMTSFCLLILIYLPTRRPDVARTDGDYAWVRGIPREVREKIVRMDALRRQEEPPAGVPGVTAEATRG
ncbi:MAG: hypothetical protein V4726_14725 [Verrucomicrobiota bacterium]